MPKIDHDTKEKILAAAEKVFHANGFKGTRTSLIAEEAGISRTMLHYYFNNKEALFAEVLKNTTGAVLGHVNKLIGEQLDLHSLIENLVEVIAGIFEMKPGLPSFIVNILNESPEMAYFLAQSQKDTIPRQLDEMLAAGRQKGEVAENITGEDLILNIYALCSIPYLGFAYIKAKEQRSDEAMKAFINQRKEKIKDVILKSTKP
jgi:TetR/AcrR family transcriptional regulator